MAGLLSLEKLHLTHPNENKGKECDRKHSKDKDEATVTRSMAQSTPNDTDSSEFDFFPPDCFGDPLRLNSTSVDEEMETKSASQLQKTFVTKLIHAKYDTDESETNYLEVEEPCLAACLEQLLDFALKEDTGRRKLVDGKKMFDGKTASEIVQMWRNSFPHLNWLLDHFHHDLDNFNLDDIGHLVIEKTALKSNEEAQNFNINEECMTFVEKFVSKMKMLKDYETSAFLPTSLDELHEKFKSVIGDIASILRILNRNNGECKSKIVVSEYADGVITYKDVICNPDNVFSTNDGALLFPVEVFTPIPESSGCDKNENQLTYRDRKFEAKHTMQHIGLLNDRIGWLVEHQFIFNTSYNELSKPHVSVGMFVSKGLVHLSKVKTTHRHMSSFVKDLMPRNLRKLSDDVLAKRMKENVQEHGLIVTKTGWHIDLAKGLHRNALMVFLVHYFWGHTYFVKRKVEFM